MVVDLDLPQLAQHRHELRIPCISLNSFSSKLSAKSERELRTERYLRSSSRLLAERKLAYWAQPPRSLAHLAVVYVRRPKWAVVLVSLGSA